MTERVDLTSLGPRDTELLGRVVRDLRSQFDALAEEAGHGHRSQIDWLVGAIASRDPGVSDLFTRCCLLVFAQTVLVDRRIDGFEVHDPPLARTLRAHFAATGRPVRVVCRGWWRWWIRSLWRLVSEYLSALLIVARRLRARSGKRSRVPLPEGSILIDTFVLGETGRGGFHDGKYRDGYYPGLLSNAGTDLRDRVVFTPMVLGRCSHRRVVAGLARDRRRFRFRDDVLELGDYLFALAHPLRILSQRIPSVELADFDVTGLVRSEARLGSTNGSSIAALLNYRFVKRLAERGEQPQLLVEWYENQVIDKGMILGFREFSPETRIIGYQGFIVSSTINIHRRPSEHEREAGAIPDQIVVVGDGLIQQAKADCPSLDVVSGPAFRFARVHEPLRRKPDSDRISVLLLLPIASAPSLEMFRVVGAAARGALAGKGIRFLVRAHPSQGSDVRRALSEASWFERSEGDLYTTLDSVDVLVGSGSSACVEALARQVPVIILGGDGGFDDNPIPSEVSGDVWSRCRDGESLVRAIDRFGYAGPALRRSLAETRGLLLSRYFNPVTPETVRQFLEADGLDEPVRSAGRNPLWR